MEKHAFDPACCLGERLQTLSRAELTALAETICRILTERGAYHGGIRRTTSAVPGTVRSGSRRARPHGHEGLDDRGAGVHGA